MSITKSHLEQSPVILVKEDNARSTNMTNLEACQPRIAESTPFEEFQPRLRSHDGRKLVSTETLSGTKDDEELSKLSRDFELAASPWIGLHYKYEDN
jgi:hypothetical protein